MCADWAIFDDYKLHVLSNALVQLCHHMNTLLALPELITRIGANHAFFKLIGIGSPDPDPYSMSAVMLVMCSRWRYSPFSRFANRH